MGYFWLLGTGARVSGAPGPGGTGRHRVDIGRAPRPDQPGGPRPAGASTSGPATPWPTLLPNGVEMFELYLAALQAGWYLVPINHHLIGPEVAYILTDSGAKAFVAHERFTDVALDAAEEAELPSSICFAVGDIPGFGSYATHARLPAHHRSGRPDHRRRHELHLGHHRQPEGRLPQAQRRCPPRRRRSASPASSSCSAIQPQDDNVHIVGSPLYHTAVMRFSGASIHLGHTVVVMDKWLPEEMLQPHRAVPGDDLAHGADPVPPPAGPARRPGGAYDVSSLRHISTPRRRARSTSSTR